jgi:hypothetical protein
VSLKRDYGTTSHCLTLRKQSLDRPQLLRSAPLKDTPLEYCFISDPTPSRTKPRNRYFRYACKTFRLNLIYSIWAKISGQDVPEEEKVAFYKSRRLAFLRGLIHWVPCSAAIVLIWFNLDQHYIGGDLSGKVGQVRCTDDRDTSSNA